MKPFHKEQFGKVRTKIVATVGPASSDPSVLRAMVEAGVDIFRLNFSHGTHAEHTADERNDVVRGPALGLVDREHAGRRVGRSDQALTGARIFAASSAARAASRTRSRMSARSPWISAPAARTWPPPPNRAMSADASTDGSHCEVRQEILTLPRCSLKRSATRMPLERAICSTRPEMSSSRASARSMSPARISVQTSWPPCSRMSRAKAKPQSFSASKRLLRKML